MTICVSAQRTPPMVSMRLPRLLDSMLKDATNFGQGMWWSGYPDWEDLQDGGSVTVTELDSDGGLNDFRLSRWRFIHALNMMDRDVACRILSDNYDWIDVDIWLQTAVFGKVRYA